MRGLVTGTLFASALLLGACRPCRTFDERVCERLGPEDCELWQGPLGKAGSPSVHEGSSGTARNFGRLWVERLLYGKNGRMCQNALESFDEVAQGIEAVVQSHAGGEGGQ